MVELRSPKPLVRVRFSAPLPMNIPFYGLFKGVKQFCLSPLFFILGIKMASKFVKINCYNKKAYSNMLF